MKKILTFILLIVVCSTTILAQTSEKTLPQLKIEKEEAVKAENYLLAGELKKQIEERQNTLEAELKIAVENEDYEKAAAIKKELNGETIEAEAKKEKEQTEETLPELNQTEEIPENNLETNIKENTANKSKTKYSRGDHIYLGMLNRRNVSFGGISNYDGYNINFEYLGIIPDKVISPALSIQLGGGAADIKNSTFNYTSDYSFLTFGGGIATNFGWNNNNTRFKPFAAATLGFGYEWESANYYYDITDKTKEENNRWILNYELRVGIDFYITEKYALSMLIGLNRYNTIGIGLTF